MKLKISPLVRENFRVSLTAVKTNRLRSVLTILIIAVGIMCLVGILTAIDAIEGSVTDQFNSMGAQSMIISSRHSEATSAGNRRRVRNTSTITYQQAREFADSYKFPSVVSISTQAKMMATVKVGNEASGPEMEIVGVDPNYIPNEVLALRSGRNFSSFEMETSTFSAIIGRDIAAMFQVDDPCGEFINVEGLRYMIIGVLENKGSGFGGGVNKQILIPISTARATYGGESMNFTIKILPQTGSNIDEAYSDANILFRNIRRLTPTDVSDFSIERSDAMLESMQDTLGYVTIAAFVIGFITLLGACVGLMNIMLVSVNERTREIGTRKAIGAKSSTIKQQFLFEATVIGQIGGLLGIVLGVLIGNIVAVAMRAHFVMPWLWIILAVGICLAVSLLSGYLPAVRASRMDPIEALRYE